ncbi:hypothetical protein D7Y56_01295 (plasmid) [Streptomyces sp. S501]|nr:hypothetical protein D7Y56_01295 [Streptomyces sp. S501]
MIVLKFTTVNSAQGPAGIPRCRGLASQGPETDSGPRAPPLTASRAPGTHPRALPACGAPSAPTSHGKGRPYDGDNNGDNIHHNNSDNNGDTRKSAALAQPQVRTLFAPGEYSDFPLTPGLPTSGYRGG